MTYSRKMLFCIVTAGNNGAVENERMMDLIHICKVLQHEVIINTCQPPVESSTSSFIVQQEQIHIMGKLPKSCRCNDAIGFQTDVQIFFLCFGEKLKQKIVLRSRFSARDCDDATALFKIRPV